MQTLTDNKNGIQETKAKENFHFAEFVKSGLTNRGIIIDITKLSKSNFEDSTDSYLSMFTFAEDYLNYVMKNKSVSGYKGDHSFNYIYVDFDKENDIEQAQKDIIDFICYGLSNFIEGKEFEQLRIFFSGSKGFHLGIPKRLFTLVKPSRDLHLRVKAFIEHISLLASEKDNKPLETIDYSIYKNCNRIFRLNNTINSKTGLYKIPLTYFELCDLSINDIKELAKTKREFKYENDIIPNEALTKQFNDIQIGKNTIDTNSKHNVNSELLEPVVKDRNNHAYKIAIYYVNLGDTENNIKIHLDDWNIKNDNPLPESEIKSVLKSAMNKANSNDSNVIDRTDFMNFEDRKNNFSQYIKDIANKKIDIGFKLIDDKIRGIRPGNVLTLLAETGIGKSSIIQNVLQKYTKQTGNVTLYLSLEMDGYELHERETQIEFNVTGQEVEEAYSNGTANYNSEHLNNFITVTKSIDVNRLPEYIEKCIEFFGEIGLIAIDHVGLMDNRFNNDNEYNRLTDVMKKIKNFALTYKYPVICISQVNRFEALKKSDRLSLFSGKGSGEVENSSNVVLALEKITTDNFKIFNYRDEVLSLDEITSYEKHGVNLLCLSILKNRRGGYIQSILEYNRSNLRITESKINDRVIKN